MWVTMVTTSQTLKIQKSDLLKSFFMYLDLTRSLHGEFVVL